MSPETRRWIDVLKKLGDNLDAEVLCPRCESSRLRVYDVPFGDQGHFERHLACPKCRAYQAARCCSPGARLRQDPSS